MGSLEKLPHLVIVGARPWGESCSLLSCCSFLMVFSGHARPLCTFSARVALLRDVHITLFTHLRIRERVQTEVLRSFGPDATARRNLVRCVLYGLRGLRSDSLTIRSYSVVGLNTRVENQGGPSETKRAEDEQYLIAFKSAYEQLLNGRPMTCASTGTEFPGVQAPNTVVIDVSKYHGPLSMFSQMFG